MAIPNIKDIGGLGEIVGHIKDLILNIVETRAMLEEKKLKNETLRLDNTRKFLDIARDFNLSPEQLKYYEKFINSEYDLRPQSNRAHTIQINAVDSAHDSQIF